MENGSSHLTTDAISARILEAARADSPAIARSDEASMAPLAPFQPVSTEHAASLLNLALKKTAPSGWRYYYRVIRRQPRLTALTLEMLAELTRLTQRFNKPIQLLHNRVSLLGERIRGTQVSARHHRAELALLKEATTRIQHQHQVEIAALKEELRALNTSVADMRTQPIADFDKLYFEFEEKFRGSEELVRQRLLVYLPYLRRTGSSLDDLPLVDLGCGRGEWLALAQEHGRHPLGVDSNAEMVQRCRFRGLPVCQNDIFDFLRNQPENSAAMVTAFHVAEHLPFHKLVELLDQSLRILASGGVVIFETPNPENVIVGSNTFYLDPTHEKPLPVELMKFLITARGFVRCEVRALQPTSDYEQIKEEQALEVTSTFSRYFRGAQDYGIIAWKK